MAARSYALAENRFGTWGSQTCDTTSCQVYGGRARRSGGGNISLLEDARTDRAIAATAGVIRRTSGRLPGPHRVLVLHRRLHRGRRLPGGPRPRRRHHRQPAPHAGGSPPRRRRWSPTSGSAAPSSAHRSPPAPRPTAGAGPRRSPSSPPPARSPGPATRSARGSASSPRTSPSPTAAGPRARSPAPASGWPSGATTSSSSGSPPRGGPADFVTAYGLATDTPLVGDWNGDGNTDIGVWRSGRFYLRVGLNGGPATYVFRFGLPTDTPARRRLERRRHAPTSASAAGPRGTCGPA